MTRTAILIGSGTFGPDSQLDNLGAPEKDVERLRATLSHSDNGVFDKVLVLANRTCQEARMTLNRVLRAATKEDQVLIYYSGHGKLDSTGRLCLAMSDTVAEALEASTVRTAEITDFISNSRCKQVMILLDCCYSGAAGKDFAPRGADVEAELHGMTDAAGVCVMTASNSVQTALENNDKGLGVFTHHVLEGIETGEADANGDGKITFDELFEYVQRKVTSEGHQRPQKWAIQAERDLVLAKSGRSEEKRVALREGILKLAHSGELPEEIVPVALELIAKKPGDCTPKQRSLVKLVEELVGGQTKLVQFVMAWTKLAMAPEMVVESMPPPKPPSGAKPPKPAPPTSRAPPPATPAPEEIANARDIVYALLQQAIGSLDLSVAPTVEPNKVFQARSNCHVPPHEELLGLIDCTIFGMGYDAIVFTGTGLYHHNGPIRMQMTYQELVRRNYQVNGNALSLGGGKLLSLNGSNFGVENLLGLLEAIKAGLTGAVSH